MVIGYCIIMIFIKSWYEFRGLKVVLNKVCRGHPNTEKYSPVPHNDVSVNNKPPILCGSHGAWRPHNDRDIMAQHITHVLVEILV